MIQFENAELNTAEPLKAFEKPDDLGKAFLDLHAKATTGSLELLPEDIRTNESVKVFKTTPELAKGFIELKKMMGTIKRPPADASGYKFTAVDGLHANVKPDANFQKVLAENAHKLGLAEDQADGVHKLAMGYVSTLVQQQEAAREEKFKANMAALKQEWGADFDKNFNNITRVLKRAGGEKGEDVVNELGGALQKAPLALRAFSKIVNLLSEDSIETLGGAPGGSGTEPVGELSGEETKEYEEMRAAISDPKSKHPLMDERHAKHQEARARYAELGRKYFTAKK